MHAHGLLGYNVGMTFAAVNRIQTAPVPTVVGTDVTFETPGRAMHGSLELREVCLVAIETGILWGCVVCAEDEWCEDEEEGDASDKLAHWLARWSGWLRVCDPLRILWGFKQYFPTP
jgi:hypothetical protein